MQKKFYPLLYEELMQVHNTLAYRANWSSELIRATAQVEKDFGTACIAALTGLGQLHAPVPQVMGYLQYDSSHRLAEQIILSGHRVAGWGSAFCKTGPDPIFTKIDGMIQKINRVLYKRIEDITCLLHNRFQRNLWPNAACYTAAVCILEDIPSEVAIGEIIRGRLSAWQELYIENYNPRLP